MSSDSLIKNNTNVKCLPNLGTYATHHTVCSQKEETFPTKEPVVYFLYNHKGIDIIQVNNVYRYKNDTFKIINGKFISSKLIFKLPTRSTITTVERVKLSLGISISKKDTTSTINIQDIDFRELLHTFTMLALKDLSIISNVFGSVKQKKYGEVVFESYLKAVTGTGRIKAKMPAIRWLNEQDTLQLKPKLFNTSGYQVGVNSMEYKPTEFANSVFSAVFKLLLSIEFENNNIEMEHLDFRIELNTLSKFKLRDMILLLNNCIGYDNGFIIRPRLNDRQHSRVYSVFTSISSETRKILEFINYDIGSALQAITMHLVDDNSIYPLHQELVDDKVAFRQKVADETGRNLRWVKTELSKIDNLDNKPKRYSKYPTLDAYYDESQILRSEIINTAEPTVLQRARDYAKPNWVKSWEDDKPVFTIDGKKDSSVFFFIWTQWERQIRESMMSCFDTPNSCHQVHDAVYSKQQIDVDVIEAKVFKDTGFKVKIAKD